MQSLYALALILASAVSLFGQTPVSLNTSDPKFAPRWVDVPAPQHPMQLIGHAAGYTNGTRIPGTYEIAYALVDEEWRISPISPAVTVTATTTDWDAVGTTPGLPLWTRAAGVLWVYRVQGSNVWKPFAVDENREHSWLAVKPFKCLTGWHHTFAGNWLFQAGVGFPDLTDVSFYPASPRLPRPPPAPVVRLLECRNQTYDVAYAWACNVGETALSPVLNVPALNLPANQHKYLRLLRQSPDGMTQPPQGALGLYMYYRPAGGVWHRQPSPDGNGYLWPLDLVTIPAYQFVESNQQPQTGATPIAGQGRSYLSSLHLALRDWNRDIVVDTDQVICCPLISEYNGKTWEYQPRNQWAAVYGTTSGAGTWTLTIDGITTPALTRTSNFGQAWQAWRTVFDQTFGPGNVIVSDWWPWYAPKIELAGKYAATDMTGRWAIVVRDSGGAVVDSHIVAGDGYTGPQPPGTGKGQSWVLNTAGGVQKFKRKIATSNSGTWKVSDAAATPDGVTGYPMGWALWLECTQKTDLYGCDFVMMKSRCGISTCDNNGGQSFHMSVTRCSVSPDWQNPQPVTYGFRCLGSSSWGWGGHLCSELIMERVHLQGKFPVVCEGNQAANWQLRDLNSFGDGTIDSAIITQTNAGAITCAGRFTCDNARCLLSAVWANRFTLRDIWIDGGMPVLMDSNANSGCTLSIFGGKINQWCQGRDQIIDALVLHGWGRDQLEALDGWALRSEFSREMSHWIYGICSPAGTINSVAAVNLRTLVTDELDSQHDWWPPPQQARLPEARLVCPVPNQNRYKPRVADEVPSLLKTLLP